MRAETRSRQAYVVCPKNRLMSQNEHARGACANPIVPLLWMFPRMAVFPLLFWCPDFGIQGEADA